MSLPERIKGSSKCVCHSAVWRGFSRVSARASSMAWPDSVGFPRSVWCSSNRVSRSFRASVKASPASDDCYIVRSGHAKAFHKIPLI
jgi:hypothetical protein